MLAIGSCLAGAGVVVAVVTVHGSGDPAAAGSLSATGPARSARSAESALAAASARPARPAGPDKSARPHARADPLGSAAASYLSTRTDTVLAAVYDVTTGQTWRLGAGPPQAEASVVKVDILETLLAERGARGLSSSDRALARQMIEDSDNDAATTLWYDVGGASKIGSFNATAGLTQTTLSSCVVCAGFPWPGWGLTTTEPTDQITLLRQLVTPGPLLTSAERSYALSLMENVTPAQRWGVCGGVPAQVTVALKNGWLPLDNTDDDWQVNSVGWISGHGRDYLIAVLTTGNPTEQYGIDTIDQLSATVWDDMG